MSRRSLGTTAPMVAFERMRLTISTGIVAFKRTRCGTPAWACSRWG